MNGDEGFGRTSAIRRMTVVVCIVGGLVLVGGCRTKKPDPVGTSTGLQYYPPGVPSLVDVPPSFPVYPVATPLPPSEAGNGNRR